MELDTQLWIAKDLGFSRDIQTVQELVQRVAARLNALITSKTQPNEKDPTS